jgi:hypothetical protein
MPVLRTTQAREVFQLEKEVQSPRPLETNASPANILIAALLPSLEESSAERVAFPPESSNLMYGMYGMY